MRRYLSKMVLVSAFILVACMLSHAADQGPGSRIVFAGSGANLPITRKLVLAFQRRHPHQIQVPDSIGSPGAIRAVADGAIALGLISRPLRKDEQGLGLTVERYAATAAVIGVHPGVPDDSISFSEVVDIYRGEKKFWRDGRQIVVLTREPGDSSVEILENNIPGFADAFRESQRTRRWFVIYSDQEMNRHLQSTPRAIGFSDLGAMTSEHLKIKALKVNGVPATIDSLQKGGYPLVKTLSFVYRQDRLILPVREFLEFVQSPEGQKVLRQNGYLHVR